MEISLLAPCTHEPVEAFQLVVAQLQLFVSNALRLSFDGVKLGSVLVHSSRFEWNLLRLVPEVVLFQRIRKALIE